MTQRRVRQRVQANALLPIYSRVDEFMTKATFTLPSATPRGGFASTQRCSVRQRVQPNALLL